MFPPAESPFRATLRHFLDVAIEFATLGEYTLDGPAEPAATSPGPRLTGASVSPGARSERVAAAAGQRLEIARAAALRPSTVAARALHDPEPQVVEQPALFDPHGAFDPERDELPPHIALFVEKQAAELARCFAGTRRSRSRRKLQAGKRRPGTPKPVPQPCLSAGE